MAFYLALNDTQWIPFEADTFIRWNDHIATWQTENQVVNGGWNLVGYNIGIYDHEVTVPSTRTRYQSPPTNPYVPFIPPTINIISTPMAQEPVLL